MFKKILIAKRSEVALRVARTCKRLGIDAVALALEGDAQESVYTDGCDHVVRIDAKDEIPIESILNIVKEHAIDVVYPGYSSQQMVIELARALEAEGIPCVGMDPDVLAIIRDQARLRAIVEQAGVRVVPPDLVSTISVTRARSLAAFLAIDSHGNAAFLCDLETSVFKDDRKLIRESPSPHLNFSPDGESIREMMFDIGIRLARELGFCGLFSAELLRSPLGELWLSGIELGLPTLHAMVEMVTQLDLVDLQLRIAVGEKLSSDVLFLQPAGHTLGAQVLASSDEQRTINVEKVFFPHLPQRIARVESSVSAQSCVSVDDWPRLAKIVTHAPVRHQALLTLDRILAATTFPPLSTNISLLRSALHDEAFRAGQYDIGLAARVSG